MSRSILVLTSVHQADDPRVRDRTVAVLARHTPVRYATQPPAPRHREDHEWRALPGGRVRRALAGLRLCWSQEVALVSLHDPELIPVGLLVRWLRRIPVVLDVHENVPAQLATKDWLAPWLRQPMARAAAAGLRLAEQYLTITLAEEGYQSLFRHRHPVFPNYPLAEALPAPRPDEGYVVYVGDVTEQRGAELAVRAVAGLRHPLPLHLVGRCQKPLRRRLLKLADRLGVELHLTGFLPHAQAMRRAAGATVALSPLADIPNYRWSLPTKVIEYLSLGVPVAAANLPGTARAVNDLPAVALVPPGDVKAWTEALQRVCDDPGWRNQAVASVPTVRARFSWPSRRLIDLYLALVERPLPAR